MCGIGGGVSFKGEFCPREERLGAFAEPLRHRGPDAEGYLIERFGHTALAFAHKRLSIIDLSPLGNQPMRSPSGHSVIVFNGEIYNYRELREELASGGSGFRSHSDTEVLLAGFERWGMQELLQRVDGMFAFALYHSPSDTLYLARDPFGKKPCYYHHDPARGLVLFSSDIRSFRVAELDLHIDPHALGYFFYELATPEQHTIWSEVRKVPPGACVVASRHGLEIRRYWTLPYTADNRLPRQAVIERVEELLRSAVRKRLVADVRVSALLSGGIDSSLVVAFMAAAAPGPVATYSVGFAEDEYNELPYARQVAERYGTRHHEFVMTAADVGDVEPLIDEYGEPFADCSMVPSYIIARTVSRNEKVVLGGDGGDELFAGYYTYYFCNKLELVKRFRHLEPLAALLERVVPSYRTRFLRQLLAAARQPGHRLLDRNMGFAREQMRALFGSEPAVVEAMDQEHARVWQEYAAPYRHALVQVLSGSLHTRLANDYLVKVDRASMYASVEMRSPFLDKDLARFAATLAPGQILDRGEPKSVLRDLAARYLPPELARRRKMGFGVPVGEWFRSELRDSLREVVLGGRQALLPLDYAYVEELIGRHEAGEDHTHRLWVLYVFHLWAQKAARRPAPVPSPALVRA